MSHDDDLEALWEQAVPFSGSRQEFDAAQADMPGPAHNDFMGHLSLDLSEATYNIPFDILDLQCDFISQLLGDFAPWVVFKEMFYIHKREVDMQTLIDIGAWKGQRYVTSECGSFMGDVLSFIHLSLYLRASVYSAFGGQNKPIGQSVGDDLILLGIKERQASRFVTHVVKTGGKTSKFNAFSRDSITFCEQFAVVPKDKDDLHGYPNSSVFGDLFFLDIIKGSLLSSKSKVKATGAAPFFGHARMLNKQVAYHPLPWVGERAGKLLWSINYWTSKKLATSMVSLPEALGGLDITVGQTVDYNSDIFQEYYLPYYEAIAQCRDDKAFLAFSLLLRGIYAANPKGTKWENSIDLLSEAVGGLKLHRVRHLDSLLPEWMSRRPVSERLSYVSKELNLGSVTRLIDELARREAFFKLWCDEDTKPYMVLPIKEARTRHHQAWKEIRRSFQPLPRSRWRSFDLKSLASMFEIRTWNVYYDKADQAISDAFDGTPDLFLRFDEHFARR